MHTKKIVYTVVGIAGLGLGAVGAVLPLLPAFPFLMLFGFLMMYQKALYIPCMILGGVWLFHILYFCFAMKTIQLGRAQ